MYPSGWAASKSSSTRAEGASGVAVLCPASPERVEAMARRRWLVRAFPRSWRSRFGTGLTDLLDDMEKEAGRIPAADRLDVARAGLAERLDSVRRMRSQRLLVACGLALSVALAGTLAALESGSQPARTTSARRRPRRRTLTDPGLGHRTRQLERVSPPGLQRRRRLKKPERLLQRRRVAPLQRQRGPPRQRAPQRPARHREALVARWFRSSHELTPQAVWSLVLTAAP